MSQLTTRLRALANAAQAEYDRETKAGGEPAYPAWISDVQFTCRLTELAYAWHAAPTQRNLAALSSHLKAMP